MLKASFLPQYTIWTIHLFSPLHFPHSLFLIFMEIRFLQPHSQHLTLPSLSCMNPLSLSSKLKPQSLSLLPRIRFRFYCTPLLLELSETEELIEAPNGRSSSRKNSRARVKVSDVQLRENWLSSLSCPPPAELEILGGDDVLLGRNDGSSCVIGIDPDVSGALAFLRTDHLGCCAQVFDSPYVQVPVGKRVRKRLDPRSIVQLVKSLDAPFGTVAYLEQSTPFPKDGKQGWWSGGFGYGLWIGILVSSGFSVVPVPSSVWKNEFELCGSRANKDSSRNLASELFPSLSSMLKRKKDHGRAEAVLIAAYGKRCRTKANEASIIAQELINSENCFANSC